MDLGHSTSQNVICIINRLFQCGDKTQRAETGGKCSVIISKEKKPVRTQES